MTDILQNPQLHRLPELSHEIEIVNLTSKLDRLVTDFTEGYKAIYQNVDAYLISTKSSTVDQERIAQTAKNFIPLRRAQILELVRISEILGIPLSPLGIVTFTSGELIQMNLCLKGGSHLADIGGNFIDSSFFSSGPSSRAGFWITQSPTAGGYTQAEIDRHEQELEKLELAKTEPQMDEDGVQIVQGYPAPVIPKKIFSPTIKEIRSLHEYQDHEAFHGVHIPLTDDLTAFDDFDKTLIKEGLAFRTALLLKTRTTDEIKKSLLEFYFADRELTDTQLFQIDQFLKIISQSLDPQYQREITWRGMCCKSLQEFISPSPELNNIVLRLVKYSLEVALPKYRSGLGL